MSDWIKSLQKARLAGTETPPAGWKTVEDLQILFGFKRPHTFKCLEDLVSSGLAEKKKFRVKCGSMVRGKFHYKLK